MAKALAPIQLTTQPSCCASIGHSIQGAAIWLGAGVQYLAVESWALTKTVATAVANFFVQAYEVIGQGLQASGAWLNANPLVQGGLIGAVVTLVVIAVVHHFTKETPKPAKAAVNPAPNVKETITVKPTRDGFTATA
jgi:Na+/H+-translocating membrane pyrophosphatase